LAAHVKIVGGTFSRQKFSRQNLKSKQKRSQRRRPTATATAGERTKGEEVGDKDDEAGDGAVLANWTMTSTAVEEDEEAN